MTSRAAPPRLARAFRGACALGLVLSAPSCLLVDPPAALHHGASGAGGELSAGGAGTGAISEDAGSPAESAGHDGSGGTSGALGDAGEPGEAGVGGLTPTDPCAGVLCNTAPPSACVSATEFKSYDSIGSCVGGVCSYKSNSITCTCQGGACTTDPCQTVSCASPPAGSCTDEKTLRTYATSGTCSAGSCSYAATDMACAFGCAGGACKPDPCGSVTCNVQPASTCSGSTLTTYDTSGTCSAGSCSYKSTSTSCAFGCASGACKPDPCTGVTCKTPPAGSCLNATTFKTYDSTGSCAGGTCTYASNTIACTCVGKACSTDPCIGVACNAPPSAICKDASTQRKYASAGTCSAGSCSYAPTDTACAFGCASGACKPDPCASVTCKAPPATVCKNTSTLTTYAASGTCNGGSCSYKATDSSCAFGCANGACKPDPCASVTCKSPPAATCSGTTRTTYASPGTCSAGSCSYSPTTTSCAFGCGSNGACQADPCTGVTCNNGGTCNSSAGGTCSCTSRFNGQHCEYQAFRGLGALPGDALSSGSNISRDGTIIVLSSRPDNDTGLPYHAARSVSGGALSAIAEIPGLTVQAGCEAKAVDAANNVVGTCETTTPFLSANSTQATQINLSPLFGSSIVTDISQSNKVVVGYYQGGAVPQSFRWTSSGTALIPLLDPSIDAYATATNGDGSIVIGWGAMGTAWRWSAQTGVTVALAKLSTDFDSANDISTDGKVIVGSDGQNCAKWSGASFAAVLLGPGVCNATSGDGSVSVGSDYEDTVALLWNSAGSHKITDLLASTPDLSGWTLEYASGVSDDGKFIVGTGYGPSNFTQAWVAHLP